MNEPEGQFIQPEPDRDLRFECPFGLHWPPLLPQSAKSQLTSGAREGFEVNSRFHLQYEAPDALWAERMRTIGYSERLPVAWVPHPLFGYPEAYWPDPGVLELIEQISDGRQAISELDEDCFELLCLGQLLVLEEAAYAEQMHALRHHWRQRLVHEMYLHLPNLISPLQLAALRAYARQRRISGPYQFEDHPLSRRYFCINDPVIKFLHQHLLQFLSTLLNEQIRASYNMISYYNDTGLGAHIDRDPCLWNLSIQLDTQPTSAEAAPWPIFLETRHGDTPIMLQAGDGLLYRGREMKHWRNPLPPDRYETVLLFHFVDQGYDGPMW